MNRIELGRKLRSAREICGISQQEAAAAIAAPRTAITQIEAGKRSVSTLELSKLARRYRVPVARFFEDDGLPEDGNLVLALPRVVPGLEHHPAVQAAVERCVDLFREGVQLEQLLGQQERSGPPSYPLNAPRTIGEAITEGERIAHDERQRIGLGHAPIADLSALLTTQGIWASGLKLPAQMSGLFLQHSSIGLGILVNAAHSRARKRFSYAHEFAHALMDREAEITVSSAENASQLIEKRANAFAAAFLMPRGGIAEALRNLDKGRPSRSEQSIFDAATGGSFDAEIRPAARSQRITYNDVALLAHHFGVSYQAAVYRLKSLRHISSSQTEQLLANERHGKNYLQALNLLDDLDKPETKTHWDRELRSEIAHLAIEAFRQEEISRGRVLEISKSLGIDGERLLVLAEAARD